MKGLAAESLQLLEKALPTKNYPELCDLDTYGAIIGMFELNNLGLSIPSKLPEWLETLAESGEEPNGQNKDHTHTVSGYFCSTFRYAAPHMLCR